MPLDISRFFNIDTTTYAGKGVVVYGFSGTRGHINE